VLVAVLLLACGKRITDEPAPTGCVAILFEVENEVGQTQLDAIEDFARGLRGEKPYPEISFEMAKGIGGTTVFRATRKTGVDIQALKSDTESWLINKPHMGVVVRAISDTGEVETLWSGNRP
jgi:hypothetical protein